MPIVHLEIHKHNNVNIQSASQGLAVGNPHPARSGPTHRREHEDGVGIKLMMVIVN